MNEKKSYTIEEIEQFKSEEIRDNFHEVIKAYREDVEKNPFTEEELAEVQAQFARLAEKYDINF